jgi:transcriptional regulator with XRE-family HTH domain
MTEAATTAVARRWPNRIRMLRTERGLQAKELASLADIDRWQLSRYERGAVIPGWHNAVAIARALGVSVADLGLEEQAEERIRPAAGGE